MNQTRDKIQNKFDELYKMLKSERDELKLKTHLMREGLDEIWQSSEKKWFKFKSKFSKVNKGVGNTVNDLTMDINVLGNEIKKAYKDIKSSIKSNIKSSKPKK